jgi:hypothetical protein
MTPSLLLFCAILESDPEYVNDFADGGAGKTAKIAVDAMGWNFYSAANLKARSILCLSYKHMIYKAFWWCRNRPRRRAAMRFFRLYGSV